MKLTTRFSIIFVAIVFLQSLYAQDAEVLDHPGYVDFSTLSNIAGDEPNVEVSLKAPLLNLITNILKNNDEQAADFISTLLSVNVRVFESSMLDTDRIAETMSEIARNLDAQQWERVVRVRDNAEHVDVYFRLSDNADVIYGIAIMVVESNETVMINIVGDISPDDISAIGARFDIDELSGLDNVQ